MHARDLHSKKKNWAYNSVKKCYIYKKYIYNACYNVWKITEIYVCMSVCMYVYK